MRTRQRVEGAKTRVAKLDIGEPGEWPGAVRRVVEKSNKLSPEGALGGAATAATDYLRAAGSATMCDTGRPNSRRTRCGRSCFTHRDSPRGSVERMISSPE